MDEQLKHIARKVAFAVLKAYTTKSLETNTRVTFADTDISLATKGAYDVLLDAVRQTNKERNETQEEALRRTHAEEVVANYFCYGH